jgi:hypothetical protein
VSLLYVVQVLLGMQPPSLTSSAVAVPNTPFYSKQEEMQVGKGLLQACIPLQSGVSCTACIVWKYLVPISLPQACCLLAFFGLHSDLMMVRMHVQQCFFFSSGFAVSRKNWGYGLALERILAWWQGKKKLARNKEAISDPPF